MNKGEVNMSEEFPYPCCRCGLCCLAEPCLASLVVHGEVEICPSLFFDGDEAECRIADLIPIGDGCCISARAYKAGVKFDFASLPKEIKIKAAQYLRKQKGA